MKFKIFVFILVFTSYFIFGIEKNNFENPKDYIINMFDRVLENNIDEAINDFNDYIWLNEFKYIISSKKLKDFIIDWKKINSNYSSVSEIIKVNEVFETEINEYNDSDEVFILLKGYYKVDIIFLSAPFFPTYYNRNKYSFLLDKVENRFVIVSILSN